MGNEYIIGASLREPHINGTSMRAVFICMYICIIMVRPSPARRFIRSVLRPHEMFRAEKSAWSKQLRHCALINRIYAIFPSWSASKSHVRTRGHVVSLTGRGRAAP